MGEGLGDGDSDGDGDNDGDGGADEGEAPAVRGLKDVSGRGTGNAAPYKSL